MSLRLINAAAEIESQDALHLSRLLVLLYSADARKNTIAAKAKAIEGITKLAKLDFLLRYPTNLERALRALGKDHGQVRVEPRERTSIETKMIRFRYGPWDARYRRWLGLLSAKGLVSLHLEGNTVQIGLTESGRRLAENLRSEPMYEDLTRRSDIAMKAVGGLTGTKLKEFVYATIPEIIDMKWGDEISV
jgi:hypothetical protein